MTNITIDRKCQSPLGNWECIDMDGSHDPKGCLTHLRQPWGNVKTTWLRAPMQNCSSKSLEATNGLMCWNAMWTYHRPWRLEFSMEYDTKECFNMFLIPSRVDPSPQDLQGCCHRGVAKKRPSGFGMKNALFTSAFQNWSPLSIVQHWIAWFPMIFYCRWMMDIL